MYFYVLVDAVQREQWSPVRCSAVHAVEPSAMQYSDRVECSAVNAVKPRAMKYSDRVQCSGYSGAQSDAIFR